MRDILYCKINEEDLIHRFQNSAERVMNSCSHAIPEICKGSGSVAGALVKMVLCRSVGNTASQINMFDVFSRYICLTYSQGTYVWRILKVPLFDVFSRHLCLTYSQGTFVWRILKVPLFDVFSRYLCLTYSQGTFVWLILKVPLFDIFSRYLCLFVSVVSSLYSS